MKRHWVFALATLVAIPRLAVAQDDPGWGPRLRVTPFVGISPGIHQNGVATAFSGTSVSTHTYREDLSSALPIGLSAEYRVWNRFSLIAEGVFEHRGDGTLTDMDDEFIYTTAGSDFWMAKLTPAIHMREFNSEMQLYHLDASLFVGPAWVHDSPKATVQTPPNATNSINQWALNMGANAELSLANNRMAFQLGLENYMIMWDQAAYRLRIEPYIQESNPGVDAVVIDAKNTNSWILRAGLSFRFF